MALALLAVTFVLLLVTRAEAGYRPRRVVVIGDSITEGDNDPQGGYPARSQVILQSLESTFTTVLNRGWGGRTTADWLAAPTTASWDMLRQIHPDLTEPAPPPVATLAEAVVQAAQPVDTVVILLGINDKIFLNATPAEVLARLQSLRQTLAPLVDQVLISTLTPSLFLFSFVEPMNDSIRATFSDYLPLGDELEAQPNWPDLMDDFVHPDADGHAVLADALVANLSARSLVGFLAPVIDGLKCYAARDLREPRFARTTVQLADAFAVNDGSFALRKPWLYCDPVGMNGGTPVRPEEKLVCYRLTGPKLDGFERPEVEVFNALGHLRLRIKQPFALCAPSASTTVP